MQKIILMLLLTACTASAIATNKAIAQKPAVQDKVACYNVITGRTFSAAECDLAFAVARTDQPDSFLEFKVIMAMAMGPHLAREKKAKATVRLTVNLVPASGESRQTRSSFFHHRFARSESGIPSMPEWNHAR
jgi:hypothetical protein